MMEDAASGNQDGGHPDHDEAGDESSSSSSSESAEEEGNGGSDVDALETNEDDDDAAMWQALAMSMVVHEAAEAASAGEAALMEPRAIESSIDGLVVPSAADDILNDEENSVPDSEDATPALPSDDTPASRSSTDGRLSDTGGQEEETDESNLPPFPKPSAMFQFFWGAELADLLSRTTLMLGHLPRPPCLHLIHQNLVI